MCDHPLIFSQYYIDDERKQDNEDIENISIVNRFVLDYIRKMNIDVVINQWWPVSFIKCIKKETNCFLVSFLSSF